MMVFQALQTANDSSEAENLIYDNKDGDGKLKVAEMVYDNRDGVGLDAGFGRSNGRPPEKPAFDDDSYSDANSLKHGSKKKPFDMSE